MTDHEGEGLRNLFYAADLESVPTTRDLIGPAVAWGDGRRRRDRWTAAGLAGAVAMAAAVGIVALRPGDESGGAGPTKPATTPSRAPVTSAVVQQQLDALRPYLPAGYRLDCRFPEASFCLVFVLTGPTGATSMAQWSLGQVVTQDSMGSDRPPLARGTHPHQSTAAIPLADSALHYPGLGYLDVYLTDSEAQTVFAGADLTDPAKPVLDTADYYFTATGTATGVHLRLSELVVDIPWKPGKRDTADDHQTLGYNPAGPVLLPSDFLKMASKQGFAAALKRVIDLEQHAPTR